MHILILGKNGQVGYELQKTLAPLGKISAWGRDELDLNSSDEIIPRLRVLNPDLIVNAAAYTAVDTAESNRETAFQVNAVAPGLLAQAAHACQAGLIHYSTDYVFDGTSSTPYREEDIANPLNVYGESKLQGEFEIRQTTVPHWIFRISGIYGYRSKNFLLTIQRLADEGKTIRVVSDQTGAPTWSFSVAQTTAEIIKNALRQSASLRNVMRRNLGVYHMTCSGETSWYGFAKAIFEHRDERQPVLEAIPTSEYPTPARRPPYWVLNNEKLKRTFSVCMPPWDEVLKTCLQEQTKFHDQNSASQEINP